MPRGDKSAYTDKQKRKAEHIEEGYEKRGVPKAEAERRAWATVNKSDHGGKQSGSGRGRTTDKSPSRNGGERGGRATKARTTATKAKSGTAKRAGGTKARSSTRSRSASKAKAK